MPKRPYRLNDFPRITNSYFPMSNNLIWIFHKHLKFNVPLFQIKSLDQISLPPSFMPSFTTKSVSPALSISVSGITIHLVTQARNYKVRFDFYILNTLPHQLSFQSG